VAAGNTCSFKQNLVAELKRRKENQVYPILQHGIFTGCKVGSAVQFHRIVRISGGALIAATRQFVHDVVSIIQ